MRKLKIMEHISLDGIIEIGTGPNANPDFPYGDWTAPYRSPAGAAKVVELYGSNFDVLLGRRTYDLWTTFWPTASGPMAELLQSATKYVVTHHPESLAWGPSEGIGPNLVEGVRSLKDKGDKDLVVAGSSTLTSVLLEHGLADELILLVDPVFIGKGKRLFAEGATPRSFILQHSEALPSGIVIHNYKADGPLKNLS